MAVIYKEIKNINPNNWLLENPGRISVVKSDNNTVHILAWSDDIADIKEIQAYAKKKDGTIMRNISEKEVKYVD